MQTVLTSLLRFSWQMSRAGLQGARELLAALAGDAGGPSDEADRLRQAVEAELVPPFRDLQQRGEQLAEQWYERLVGHGTAAPPAGPLAPEPPAANVRAGSVDPSRFVVLGEGLAAGMADFGLKSGFQQWSFPALMAARMGVSLRQPLVEAPGLGDVPGLPRLPVRAPALMQTTVLEEFPPQGLPQNLALPGLTLREALELRPRWPVVRTDDAKQTALNLVLGLPALFAGGERLPTVLEAALAQRPTLALVVLGYAEAVAATVEQRAELLPAPADFAAQLAQLVDELHAVGARVLLATVPDPCDTAGASSLEAAGRVLAVEPRALAATYGLAPGDRLTPAGLFEIGCQLLAQGSHELPAGAVLPAALGAAISQRVAELNQEVARVAARFPAHLFDLHAIFRRVRQEGLVVGGRRLSADYLGGVFTLNGFFPGRAAHAALASEALAGLNQACGAAFRAVDGARALAADPVARYQAPSGAARSELPPRREHLPHRPRGWQEAPVPLRLAPAAAQHELVPPPAPALPLRLPPGLRQRLPLARSNSYHGDAIRIVHCDDPRSAQFGASGDLYFGGLVLYDSHLSGELELRFSPPQGSVSHFEIELVGELNGDDGVLAAPQLFRWPVLGATVSPAPGFVSSGDLDLATGEVSNLEVFVFFRNSALAGLIAANPHFPRQPIAFPGQYGSAWARFEPRPDGLLDFTFYGTTFLPLGARLGPDPVRWALPFSTPAGGFATMPAAGMAMHPHLHLSTCEREGAAEATATVELKANTVEELTLFARNSSFGDLFRVESDDLGGPAKGRSQTQGRLELQLGEPFGDSLSVAVSSLAPGGWFAPLLPSPLPQVFPGRLTPGPVGHDEFLRFPRRTYGINTVTFLDDPFDLAVGALDLASGRLRNQMLRRGFVGQNVFYSLIRVEPRTPQSSFFYRGPAVFERGAAGERVFRLRSVVTIPYPPGFLFPAPDLTTAFPAGPGSALDPFLWQQGMSAGTPPGQPFVAEGRGIRASNGNEFSYRVALGGGGGLEEAFFEYENLSQGACFRLLALSWAAFTHSRESTGPEGAYDTVSLTGFGTWSKDGGRALHQVAVQVSTAALWPYVSIQVDGGLVSNVNTKPQEERLALP